MVAASAQCSHVNFRDLVLIEINAEQIVRKVGQPYLSGFAIDMDQRKSIAPSLMNSATREFGNE